MFNVSSIVALLSLILRATYGEFELVIFKSVNNAELPVASVVAVRKLKELTLICNVADTENGKRISNRTSWRREAAVTSNRFKAKWSLMAGLSRTSSIAEELSEPTKLSFVAAKLHHQGVYLCTSAMYNLSQAVYIRVWRTVTKRLPRNQKRSTEKRSILNYQKNNDQFLTKWQTSFIKNVNWTPDHHSRTAFNDSSSFDYLIRTDHGSKNYVHDFDGNGMPIGSYFTVGFMTLIALLCLLCCCTSPNSKLRTCLASLVSRQTTRQIPASYVLEVPTSTQRSPIPTPQSGAGDAGISIALCPPDSSSSRRTSQLAVLHTDRNPMRSSICSSEEQDAHADPPPSYSEAVVDFDTSVPPAFADAVRLP